MSRRPFRERFLPPRPDPYFRWRGHEVSRLEGFSDAVFAFAVTLLVVALEVPRTFEGLLDVVRGFPAFVVSFLILMAFWGAHYRFFRRYGLSDHFTRAVNIALLLMVLFSVYPLKFLFFAVLGSGEHSVKVGSLVHFQELYRIYGYGLAGIWALYAVLYAHALRQRDALELNAAEVIQTRGQFCHYLINVTVCLTSVVLSYVTRSGTAPGLTYLLLAPLLTLNGRWHGRQVRALADGH
jgi:uncharacterized membrane protein